MKKFTLSAALIIIFFIYIYAQHVGSDESSQVVMPSSLANASTNPSSETQAVSPSTPNPTSANLPTQANTPKPITRSASGYKDGSYTGPSTDAFYGNVHVKVTISGGKIADVAFLDYPQDRGTSVQINSQAMPYLKQEAIQAQSANVDIVSGATQTSMAFQQSLQSALAMAKV